MQTMATFMPPPPAATFLAFHPQDNNIIAIGMDDSTIQIYNVRVDEVKSKLKGHSKRITGLAFSNVLNVLVSSGADAQVLWFISPNLEFRWARRTITSHIANFVNVQLCVWNTDGWEKQRSKVLQVPQGRSTGALSDTRVQFHQDQVHFLVVHETQLAIYETTKLECMKQVFSNYHFSSLSLQRSICIWNPFRLFQLYDLSGLCVNHQLQSHMPHSHVIANWYTQVSWMLQSVSSPLQTFDCVAESIPLRIFLLLSGEYNCEWMNENRAILVFS